MELRGIFPALVTPFASDESVSLSALQENICLYNETGVSGLVILGSTGESVMLTREEADAILVAAKEAAAPNKILIAGTGAESTAETIARLSCGKLFSPLSSRSGRVSHSDPSLFRAAIHWRHSRNSGNPDSR
jgi:hypothetical protein